MEVRKLRLHLPTIAMLEWVSLVVVAPKKNGKWLVCVDFKPRNATIKRDWPFLLFQDEVLDKLLGYECYTMCDVYSSFLQIRIALEDQLKTTFIAPWGYFSY